MSQAIAELRALIASDSYCATFQTMGQYRMALLQEIDKSGLQPADPLDWPLPCDVKVGGGTMRKGVTLRTLVLRMEALHRAAFGDQPAPEEAARNLAILQGRAEAKQGPVALEAVYETIIKWDEGGGKRSRRELARRICALYSATQPAAPAVPDVQCPHCHGEGIDGEPGDGIVGDVTWACEECNGAGKISQSPAAPAVPAEYKLVPVEPTKEMLRAALMEREGTAVYRCVSSTGIRQLEDEVSDVFAAMLAAAPEVK